MRIKTAFSVGAALIFGAAIGCSGQPPVEGTSVEEASPQMASHAANTGGRTMAAGSVIETMDSGGYTYVKVDTGEEEIWAAAGRFEVAVGDRVTFPLETPMQDFHSNTLDRDFPEIYFVSFIAPEGEGPVESTQAASDLPPGHPQLGASMVDHQEAIAVGDLVKPDGATSIEDVWNKRAELAGSTVMVSGRVVKYNAAILGHNWFHIQDGTGDVATGSGDLTVTTSAELKVGDVVNATGIVSVDRDFGAGYTYTVMLEEAAVTKQ